MYNYKKCVLYVTFNIIFSFSMLHAMSDFQKSITDPETVARLRVLPKDIQKKIFCLTLPICKKRNIAHIKNGIQNNVLLKSNVNWDCRTSYRFANCGRRCLQIIVYWQKNNITAQNTIMAWDSLLPQPYRTEQSSVEEIIHDGFAKDTDLFNIILGYTLNENNILHMRSFVRSIQQTETNFTITGWNTEGEKIDIYKLFGVSKKDIGENIYIYAIEPECVTQ